MILGFSQSRGIIEGSQVTVVAASVCLQTPMQMAQEVKILHNTGQKSDVVEADTIIELVKVSFNLAAFLFVSVSFSSNGLKILAVKHYEHTKKIPERLIVYRDGGNDGDFDKIHNQEAEAVLEAITELHRCEASNSECHRWCQCSKCKALAPTLTFAIAQKDHDICVVPSNQVIQYKSNVPSGTVVETDSGFLLTSQGGLKGTSKPIKYRFIQNDEYLKNGLLENLTYQMAFQCKFWLRVFLFDRSRMKLSHGNERSFYRWNSNKSATQSSSTSELRKTCQ